MMLDTWLIVTLVLSGIPCALFLLNLLAYRPLRRDQSSTDQGYSPVSVLIPARNEEQNIAATIEAVLASRHGNFELVVMDDHSRDRTAAIVQGYAAVEPRVRLETAPPLPAGWCGKQHACYALAHTARHGLLLFIDADVRLSPHALERVSSFMNRHDVALASGVPHQQLGTWSERLLLPLIHFVLLGFLPVHWMRRSTWPAMSGGCGQLFIARREAYFHCGGHSAVRNSLHDGIKLPRAFRTAGFRTDLFDATDAASCRMYQTNAQTWHGLGKNAVEALAAPGLIGPMTVLLIGGQVLPFLLLPCAASRSWLAMLLAFFVAGAGLIPRLIAVRRFRQPLGSALLHPIGVLLLVAIQWWALLRHLLGRPAEWKGRQYGPASATIELIQNV